MIKRGVLNKRGQEVFGMSFGMIFAIFVIITLIAVAFYVISYFLDLGKCTDVGLFYDDLQGQVNKAWTGGASSVSYSGKLPSGVEFVCFGNLSSTALNKEDETIRKELFYSSVRDDMNSYLYPQTSACSGGIKFYNIQHIKTIGFFCSAVQDGKIKIKIEKNVTEALVGLRNDS